MGDEIDSGEIKNNGDGGEINYGNIEFEYYNGEFKISGEICVLIKSQW